MAVYVRDIEADGYAVRLHCSLNEVEPVLPSVNGDALVVTRRYAAEDPTDVFDAFRATRETNLGLVRSLSEAQRDRPATFDGDPNRSALTTPSARLKSR